MIWYRFDCANAVLLLDVQVQPGARFAGPSLAGDGAQLKVKIPARALDGAANAALVAALAERLGVAKSSVKIVLGANARRKAIEVRTAAFDPAQLLPPGSA